MSKKLPKTGISKTNPVAPYLGGKRNLAKRIYAIIDADTEACLHRTFAEPFVGMGGIFLRRTAQPNAEFINDVGRDVYNLFRILQEHYVAFLDLLRFQLTTQANFNRLTDTDPETLTDLQRAARFLISPTHSLWRQTIWAQLWRRDRPARAVQSDHVGIRSRSPA